MGTQLTAEPPVRKAVARARAPWGADDVCVVLLLPYVLTFTVLVLCVPVMLVAWGVSAVLARVLY
jgi:hypothetical protein